MFVICKCQTAVEHILHTYVYGSGTPPTFSTNFPVYLSVDHLECKVSLEMFFQVFSPHFFVASTKSRVLRVLSWGIMV